MNFDNDRYSTKFMPVLFFLFLVGLVVVLCGFLFVNLTHKDDLRINELPGALAIVETGELLLAIIIVLIFKITITSESIKGYGWLGFNRQLKWDQIVSVKPFSMLFQKYLRVYTNDGKSPLWLPLFLKNGESFKKKLLESAPEGNPLREFFEGYNF